MTATATPRAVVNPAWRPVQVPLPAGHEVMRFHAQLPGYRSTPLHDLGPLRVGSVQLKDESDRYGLPAFKILGVSWAVEQILARDPAAGTTLVAASAGNHGRAVARVAAGRGLPCRIYLPAMVGDTPAELIEAEGAQVVRVDGNYDDAIAAAEHATAQPGTLLIADTGTSASASAVIDGYGTLFREAAAQASAPFDLVIVPVGVGALAAAAVRFAAHHHPAGTVVGVEPVTAACVTASLATGRPQTVPTPGTSMTGLNCGTPSAAAWPTLRDGLTGTITVTDTEAQQAMRDLAGYGLIIGMCGAAPLAALRALLDDDGCRELRAATRLSRSSQVLCLGTEGAGDARRSSSRGR
jgi:diaminopropionate ammonia-lyase